MCCNGSMGLELIWEFGELTACCYSPPVLTPHVHAHPVKYL